MTELTYEQMLHSEILGHTAMLMKNVVGPGSGLSRTSYGDEAAAIYAALANAHKGVQPDAAPVDKPSAAEVRKSITNDALISFEDGKPYKMLKRHLATLGLTPDQYRAKWGLPADYPVVAPGYSAKRSSLAKASGLGRKA